jgi:hypothetical protein
MHKNLKTKGIIAVCGSMKLKERMIEIGRQLEEVRYKILYPNLTETNDYTTMFAAEQTQTKHRMIVGHLEKIRSADAILVINETLKDTNGYIGANTFLEMGFAFSMNKKIFLLQDIPDQPNKVEIAGLLPTVLHANLTKLYL